MLTELFFALVSVLTLLRFDLSPEFVRNMVLACCLFCLSLVDLEIFEIPNGCLLIPVIGLYLGVAASLFALFFSCILGLIMGAIQKRGKENKGPQIPFGPAIALAFYAMLLYGDGLVNWYMGLL